LFYDKKISIGPKNKNTDQLWVPDKL
jgi:hypothetical protein